jgi:ubiquinone/menaquinone biosynthesis C-methylase UbiE
MASLSSTSSINEEKASAAFSKQAVVFDALYSADRIVQYKRKRVRAHVLQYAKPNGKILELNAGTGEDAIYFARQGYRVHATDISSGMQTILAQKVDNDHLSERITNEICSYTELETLIDKGPYDHIFSNFAGLNCTDRLDKVLGSFAPLLQKQGMVTLVVLPKFCLWEFALLLKGKWKTAFRRFAGKKGARSHIEGEYFTCWYYDPSFIIKALENEFELLSVEGLCTLVPPSYIQGFAEKYPRLFTRLCQLENRWRSNWPWRSIGDYYIISLRKR